VKGRREGFGTMVYSSGNYYEGEWVADKVWHSIRLCCVMFCSFLVNYYVHFFIFFLFGRRMFFPF
jgi:MORN repeat